MSKKSIEANSGKLDYLKLVGIFLEISDDEVKAAATKPGQSDFEQCCGHSIYKPGVDKIAEVIAGAYGSGQDAKQIRSTVNEAFRIHGSRLYLPETEVSPLLNERMLTATLLHIYEKVAAELAKGLQKPESAEVESVREKVADATGDNGPDLGVMPGI